MKLTDGSKALFRIVIPANPTRAQEYAGRELARYLNLITQRSFPVVTADAPKQGAEIVLGPTGRPGTPPRELRYDGYALTAAGGDLFIQGSSDRGVLYGVYGLLERYLGCDFLSERVEHVPVWPEAELPEPDEVRVPAFWYRSSSWNVLARHPEFVMKRGMNASIYEPFPEELGGSIQYNGFVHTFKLYIPDEEFFETHPEYFCMVDGKRMPGAYSQLCLTNEDVFRIMLERVLKSIEAHPECEIVSLSQNDGFNPCTCPECAGVDAEEGGYAGTLVRFVNRLAREIGKKYPNITVDTLAYRQTRQPPRLTAPEPNVCVRMCTIESCFSHPIAECSDESAAEKVDGKETTSLVEDMEAWGRICKKMFVWDYTTNFHHYLAPFPNLAVLQKNVQWFIRQNVTGLFEQGNGESVSGEFGELRAYLISRLMWEPDGDVSAWTDRFLTGYYGAEAAGPIRAYIDMLHAYVREENVHVGIYQPPEDYLPDWLLEKAHALWDQAESKASGEVLERIHRSRLQLEYAELRRMPLDDPERKAKMDRFERDVRRYGILNLQEFTPREKTLEHLRNGDLSLIF